MDYDWVMELRVQAEEQQLINISRLEIPEGQ